MVLSYANLSEYYHKPSSFNIHAIKSLNDISHSKHSANRPYLTDSRFSRPTFILDRDSSDSESEDDEYMDMLSLFDLPVELFVNGILPQMNIGDLQSFRATCSYAKSIVEMSEDWDLRYHNDFRDVNPLPGSGFARYARRAGATCMISGIVSKGSKLKHSALGSFDQDIVQMRANHQSNKTWMAPFMPLKKMQPVHSVATTDLFLGGDHHIYQIGETETKLKSQHNTMIEQLDASLALNRSGDLFRIKFNASSGERSLTLAPLDLPPIYDFMSIKNFNYALAHGIGLISWQSSDEQGKIDYATILATETNFLSFAVYEHTYGTLVDVALSTGSTIYTVQFDKSGTKAGMYNTLEDSNSTTLESSKVVYYEDGTFLALCPNDYVYRLKNNTVTPVASLRNISDLVVSKQGFCMALNQSGEVFSWDLRSRREISTWAIGSIIKGTRVPIANPQVAKIDGNVVSISCNDKFAFALVA